MIIEVVNSNGDYITDFELEANPFKIGEKIFIGVHNHKPDFWNIKELSQEFIVDDIEHYIRMDYFHSEKYSQTFTACITVSEIN